MKIHWLGHSCFRLEESTGTAIVTDPYDTNVVGINMDEVSADAVTISHQHKGHNCCKKITGNPEILDTLGSWDINGVGIMSLHSFHDSKNGKKRGNNLIFKYRMDGVDLCHMGDIGEESTIVLGEAIGAVDVLMIPIGGNSTIDAEQAKEYVDFLMPDIVIPMHFRTANNKYDLDKLNAFLQLFDDEQIMEIDGETIEFDRSNFDGEDTKVIVFNSDKF